MSVAGGGVIYAEATETLRKFVDGTGIPVGSRLDATNTTTRVVSTDSSARAAAGVPSSGTVKSGTSVSGKSGGFGGKLCGGSGGG
jgi:TPP-dependent trihydroxycyclohexane-1,2-dione (THcHDO) dehydratase